MRHMTEVANVLGAYLPGSQRQFWWVRFLLGVSDEGLTYRLPNGRIRVWRFMSRCVVRALAADGQAYPLTQGTTRIGTDAKTSLADPSSRVNDHF